MQRSLASSVLALALLAPARHKTTPIQHIPFGWWYLLRPAEILTCWAGFSPTSSARISATFIVENMPGVGGAATAIFEAKQSPYGYVLMFGDTGAMAITPAMNPNIGYDPIKDFAPMTALAAAPTVLVANLAVQAATLADLIAFAKKEPERSVMVRLVLARFIISPWKYLPIRLASTCCTCPIEAAPRW